MGEQKRGSWIIRLVITLAVVALVIASPFIALYICFYDNGAKAVKKDPEFNASHLLQDSAVRALEEVKDKEALVFNISENDLNQMLLEANDTITNAFPTLKKFYMGANIQTGDEEYMFAASAKVANVFKTRIKFYTTLSKETINDEESLVFKIKNIKLGRVNVKSDNSTVQKVLHDDFLTSMLQQTGFSFISDVEKNNRIYYPKSSVQKDLDIFQSKEANSFYDTVIGEFYNQELFDVSLDKNGLNGIVNLKPLHTNENYVTPIYENDADWDSLKEKTKTILESSDLTDDEGIMLYNYLIYGFDKVDADDKEFIQNLSLESIGIDDPTTYPGILLPYDGLEHPGCIVHPEKEIFDLVDHDIDVNLDDVTLPKDPAYSGREITLVNEKDLSATLATSDSIGIPYLMSHRSSNGKYTVCTFTIDNMYANIYDNSIKLTIGFNINGYETYICIGAKYVNADKYNFTFNVNEIYYGEKRVTESFGNEVSNMIFEALKDDKVCSFDKETNNLVFSIEEAFNETQKAKIDAYGFTHQVVGDTVNDEGKLVYILG